MKLFFLLAASILATAASAQSSKDTAVQNISMDTLAVTAQRGAPVYRAAATREWDIRHTRIALSFNGQAKTADAREWITLHPYCYATGELTLDAKGMRIDSVMLAGKTYTALAHSYDSDRLHITLPRKYRISDTLQIYLRYTAMPYAEVTGGSGAITDDRGLYFINTDHKIPYKPSMIWTQGETESNSHWMITIDKPNTRFTTQVELTVPDSLTTLSNGILAKQIRGAGGMRTDIWKMDMPIQAYVAMIAVGKFNVVKDHWRGKDVNYYVEPEFAPYAKLMFNHTPEMLDYFSQVTGVQFPWPKYSQVVVRDYVSGAMENTSAALFGEFVNQNAREIADHNWEDVVSHELFHEWFGDYVTCESWSNITVNESFANFGEQLWRAHYYGKASADELAYGDLQGYISSALIHDPELVRYYYDSREDVFDGISYNKGGAILRYIRALAGDTAFSRAMTFYLTRNALHSAEAQNWRMALEEATGRDWNWFFNQWYYRGGHPVLKVSYDYDDAAQALTVILAQTQDDSSYVYNLPLKAAVAYGAGKSVIEMNMTRRRDTLRFGYVKGERPVFIPDCTHVLPGEVRDGKKPAQWLAQYVACDTDDYIGRRLAIAGAAKLKSDSSSQELLTLALSDHLKSIRGRALAAIKDSQNEKYRRKWKDLIMAMAKNDPSKTVRADAVEVLGEWKITAARPIMLDGLTDSSYALAGASLKALARLDKDTAYTLALQLLPYNPKADLQIAIWNQVGDHAADADITLYEHYAPRALGNKKFAITSSLSTYLDHVKSEDAWRRGLSIYGSMVTLESMRGIRLSLGGMLFQDIAHLKSDADGDSDAAKTARARLASAKPIAQTITDSEPDPEVKKKFEKLMKENFE